MNIFKFIKRKICKPLVRFILIYPYFLFYDRKYLRSKWFDIDHFLISYKWLHRCFFEQKVLKINSQIKFPCSRFVDIASSEKIEFNIDDLQNFMVGFGNYYQNFSGNIKLGKKCYIAHNVALITANHDVNNLDNHVPPKDIVLGDECWIGINSVLLPGVVLGNKTIVGAGAVVTKSFPEGNCVIGGNPAKIIKRI